MEGKNKGKGIVFESLAAPEPLGNMFSVLTQDTDENVQFPVPSVTIGSQPAMLSCHEASSSHLPHVVFEDAREGPSNSPELEIDDSEKDLDSPVEEFPLTSISLSHLDRGNERLR